MLDKAEKKKEFSDCPQKIKKYNKMFKKGKILVEKKLKIKMDKLKKKLAKVN
jgi:hypothetical protein